MLRGRKSAKRGAVLPGRAAQKLLDVVAEEGEVGELQFAGNFLDALVRLTEQDLDVVDHVVIDQFGGGAAAGILAHAGEVLARDAEAVGVEGDRAGLGIGGGEQFDKGEEHLVYGLPVAVLGLYETLQDLAELVVEGAQQIVEQLLLIVAQPLGDAGKDEVVVEAEGVDVVGVEVEYGRLLEKQNQLPRIAGANADHALRVGLRQADAAHVEILAGRILSEDVAGVADEQVVRAEGVRPVVDAERDVALQAEQYGVLLQLDEMAGLDVGQFFQKGDAVVAVDGYVS